MTVMTAMASFASPAAIVVVRRILELDVGHETFS
jgi:hypothetical protein